MKLTTKLLAAGVLFAAAQANAISIDFTDAAIWGVNGSQTVKTVGDVRVTSVPGPLFQDEEDGLGVFGVKEEDEIDNTESIEIEFLGGDVWIEKLLISDFFNRANEQPLGDGSDEERGEVGYISFWLDGTELSQTIYGDDSVQVPNGEQLLTYAPLAVVVDKITFSTKGLNDDFSIKGLDYFIVPREQSVPEPSIAVLLGLGLMGLGLSRRRQAKKV